MTERPPASATEYQRRVREAAGHLARHYLHPVETPSGGIHLGEDVATIDPAGDRERHLSCSRTELRELLYGAMLGIEAEAGVAMPTEGRVVLASRLASAVLDAFDVEAEGF